MNRNLIAFVLLLVLAIALGCNLGDWVNTTPRATNGNTAVVLSNVNASTISNTADSILNTEKSGIPECDQLLVLIEQQIQNDPDQTMVEQLARQAAKNFVYSQVRGQLANITPENRAQLAKRCQQFADNLNAMQ